jgi:hypothetical protein
MRVERLLRLYPRAWRERYGEEFLAIAGEGPLTFQQRIDIVSGAVDAWLSADVRHATRPAAAGGGTMTVRTMLCTKDEVRYTARDARIGAAVMILGSIGFALAGTALHRMGMVQAGQAVLNIGFFVALLLSMPFSVLKGQPRKAQVAMVGSTVFAIILVAIASTL